MVPCLTTHMKDDLDFSQFLPSSLNIESVLYLCDIESLYTSITTYLCIEATDYWCIRKRNLILSNPRKKILIPLGLL